MQTPESAILLHLLPTLPQLATILAALLAGLALGAFFYGGLWCTVLRGTRSSRPASWFLISLMLRMSLLLTSIYLVADGQWQRLMACMAGLLLARSVFLRVSRQWRSTMIAPTTTERESHHAP